jgi:transglutaminase-like putative cysteine protease
MTLQKFFEEDEYIDFSSQIIQEKVKGLFEGVTSDLDKARIAYEFVRDEIPHSFDIGAKDITAKASDVLKYKTGICHAKANLLAALLRCVGIPCGICFQRLTLADDDSQGYCVHAYNAVYVDNRWIKLDARGNKNGVDAQFSLDEPKLAYPPRSQYDEYYYEGVYAKPHKDTMVMLENAKCLQDIRDNIPDYINEKPDIE